MTSPTEARRLTLLTLFAVTYGSAPDSTGRVRLSRPDLWRFVAPQLTSRGIGRNAFSAALRDLTAAHPGLLREDGTAHGRRPVVAVLDPAHDPRAAVAWRDAALAEGLPGITPAGLTDLGIPSRALGSRRGLAPDSVVLTDGRVRLGSLRAEAAEDVRMAATDDEGRLECGGCHRLLDFDEDFSEDGLRRRRCRTCERARARRRRNSPIPEAAPPQRRGRGGRHLRSSRSSRPVAPSSAPEATEAEIAASEAAYAAEERARRACVEIEHAARAVAEWPGAVEYLRASTLSRSVERYNAKARKAMDALLAASTLAVESASGVGAGRAFVEHQLVLERLDRADLEHRRAVMNRRPFDVAAHPLPGLAPYVAPEVSDLIP